MGKARRRGCGRRRKPATPRVRRALRRKRGMVLSLVGAAPLVLVAGLWAAGTTGDAGIGVAGVGLALGVLFFANEAEGGK